MDLPDIVKITIAGGFAVTTAIVGAVVAGPTSNTDFAGSARVSDSPAGDLRLADWQVPDRAFDPLLSTAGSFDLPIRPVTGPVTLSDSFDVVRAAESDVWPVRGFPRVAARLTERTGPASPTRSTAP